MLNPKEMGKGPSTHRIPWFQTPRMLCCPQQLKVQCHTTSPSGRKPSFAWKECSSNCTWGAKNGEYRSTL